MSKYLLTVAGFDPTGGAGIIRDSLTFFREGFIPLAVPTAWTVQDGKKVYGFVPLSPEYVKHALSLMLDKKPPGVKIGMVGSEEIVKVLYEILKNFEGMIIFDPVIHASGGESLFEGNIDAFFMLFSISHVITPNRKEGELLTGLKKPEEVVKKLKEKTKGAVVLTGSGDYDLVYDGERMIKIEGKKIPASLHGSGCRFSSYMLSFVVRGVSVEEAVKKARRKVEEEIERGKNER